jgi:hypothetical protein
MPFRLDLYNFLDLHRGQERSNVIFDPFIRSTRLDRYTQSATLAPVRCCNLGTKACRESLVTLLLVT